MKIIRKFFKNVRQRLFTARIRSEIHGKIFPHLTREAHHDYPFGSHEEMVKLHIRGRLQTSLDMDLIQRAAARMPKEYGDAFCYVVYRDLNRRMEMYMEVAEGQLQQENPSAHYATTPA